MKRASFIANIVLTAIILYVAGCETKDKSDTGAGGAGTEARLPAGINCDSDAFYGLTSEEFIRGIARYRKTHWDVINRDVEMAGTPDARADWYSIDTLKKYICLIEKYARPLGLTSDKLGIRFYYATYPAKGVWEPAYAKRHTLFLVPTYKANASSGNIDFDPRYSKGDQKIYTIASIYSANKNAQLLVLDGATANEATGLARNQGQLCPPTCPVLTENAMNVADRTYPTGLGRN